MFGFSSAEPSQSGDDAACAVYTGWNQGCREPGIQTHGGPDQEKPSGLAPRATLGVALVLARPAVANWWISNREGSVSGGLFRSIH